MREKKVSSMKSQNVSSLTTTGTKDRSGHPRRIDTTENSRLLKPSQETTAPSNGTVLELNI